MAKPAAAPSLRVGALRRAWGFKSLCSHIPWVHNMADKTIYTSYITLDGKPATDFAILKGHKVFRWALQSVDSNNTPCKHYKVNSGGRTSWETVELEEALHHICK